MSVEREVSDLCGDCLSRVQTEDFARGLKAKRDVEFCCGEPRYHAVSNLQKAAAREQRRRGKERGQSREQILREPNSGNVADFIRQNPYRAGAVMGLGFLVLSSVSSGGEAPEMEPEESAPSTGIGDTSLEESGDMVKCPECGCEVSKPGFVGHCGFSEDHELTHQAAADLLAEFRDEEPEGDV